MKKVILRRGGALLLTLALMASLLAVPAAAVDATGIEISPSGSVKISVNDRYQLSYALTPSGASDSVTWDSSDPAVATVTQNGLVIGTGAGQATISVKLDSDNSIKAECTVTVENKPKDIQLDKTSLEVSVGETKTLRCSYLPADAEGDIDTDILWETRDPNIATVTNGAVTGVGYGETEVTATSRTYGWQVICSVTVFAQATSIELMEDQYQLKTGEWTKIRVNVLPVEAKNAVTFKVTDGEGVVKVDEEGIITALKEGTATITVTAAQSGTGTAAVTKKCKVTVTQAVSSLELDSRVLTVQVKDTATLQAYIKPKGIAGKDDITWTVGAASVASIQSVRQVTAPAGADYDIWEATIEAKQARDTLITVTAGKQSAQCRLRVSQIPAPPTISLGQELLIVSLTVGNSRTVTPVVKPADAEVTWTSADPKVARVDENGVITGVAAGSTTVTATVGGGAGENQKITCTVTVRDVDPDDPDAPKVPLQSLELRNSSLRLDKIGETAVLEVRALPADHTDQLIWTSDDEKVVTVVGGELTAVAPGETTVTVAARSDPSIYDTCVVTVSGVRLILNDDSQMDDPPALEKVEVKENSSKDLSYKRYGAAIGQGVFWEIDDTAVATISGGRVTGRIIGTTRVTVTAGDYKSVPCEISVVENTSGVTTGEAEAGKPFSFSGIRYDLYEACREATDGGRLSYITALTVAPSQGTLYYNYNSPSDTGAGVAATDRFYYSDSSAGHRMIANLTFVPNDDFTGTAEITYTGWGEKRETYSGTIRLYVEGIDDVSYTTKGDTPIEFQANDFNTICRIRTGRDLSYVTFELPQESRGTLYYNYSAQAVYPEKVTASTQYSRSRNPSLDRVTFLPADGFGGTVTIPYRGVDTSGSAYSGRVTITVNNRDTISKGGIQYTANPGERVRFYASHFNRACRDVTGESLDYVRFSLPQADEGTLYYNYRSSSNPGTRVSSGTYYYRGGSPSLDSVSFVPASRAPDRVVIDFTGYSIEGTSFQGKVYIDTGDSGDVRVIQYSVQGGQAVTFQPGDFNDVCEDALGSTLSYVRFSLPSSSQGLLCYQYNSSRGTYASRVSASTSYYRTGGTYQLGSVSFLAGEGYSGTAQISYTGYSRDGDTYRGTVEIRVTSNSPVTVNYSGRSDTPIRLTSSSLRSACGSVMSQALSYIQFTSLPSSSSGRLYSNYSGSGTGSQVSSGTRFYVSGTPGIDQLTFVPERSFQGTASLYYNGVSTSGERVNGRINITVTRAGASSAYFTDMGGYPDAVAAVDYLYEQGVVAGMGGGAFGPGLPIKRCDFVQMLCKGFGFSGGGSSGFADVDDGAYYAQAVAAARSRGVVSGDGVNFMPENQLSRQDAMVMVCNALTASGWSLGNGAAVDLSLYGDSGEISGYARYAVGSLVQLGAVGRDSSRLRPQDPITRAEMAVLLHYVITM